MRSGTPIINNVAPDDDNINNPDHDQDKNIEERHDNLDEADNEHTDENHTSDEDESADDDKEDEDDPEMAAAIAAVAPRVRRAIVRAERGRIFGIVDGAGAARVA
ncbi:MAG: hypothetical protein RLZZ152_2218, partial [Pseudomonadota bacterium]